MTQRFLHGHEQFKQAYFSRRDELARLAQDGQRPTAMFIGCSDSRVVPEILTNAGPGELFVVRNVANRVPPRLHVDQSVGAAIEYAVGPLGVSHIVVCGHTGCGGVMAALTGAERLPPAMPELREWISAIETDVSPLRLDAADPEELLQRAVEQNVLTSLSNLVTFDVVRERLEAGLVQLHGWVYDLHTLSLSVYDVDTRRFQSTSAEAGA